MERQTLVFATERETKNTVRFQEEANKLTKLQPILGLDPFKGPHIYGCVGTQHWHSPLCPWW